MQNGEIRVGIETLDSLQLPRGSSRHSARKKLLPSVLLGQHSVKIAIYSNVV